MQSIVLFNAAPGGGKDVAAQACVEAFGGEHFEFKQKLFEIALNVANIAPESWWRIYNNRSDPSSANKESPLPVLGGLSQREFLIKISEEWVKPIFGDSYFGDCAVSAVLSSNYSNFFFSDSGFMAEAESLTKMVGRENVLLVQIQRDGHTFEGDSRDYLPLEGFSHFVIVKNNRSLSKFRDSIVSSVGSFLYRTGN